MKRQRLLLEYDDERSGPFEPLREVPDDKMVVLGLVTTKSPRQETAGRADGAHRAKPAAMCRSSGWRISPQCGFATSVIGNAISIDDERRKLKVLARYRPGHLAGQ